MTYADLLNQSITISSQTSYDEYGTTIFSDPVDYDARVQLHNNMIQLPTGQTVEVLGKVFLPSDAVVTTNDKLTYNNIDYKVMNNQPIILGDGDIHHIEVDIGKWQ